MGKKKIPVKKSELEAVINELEANNTYSAESHLFAAVAETEWAKRQKITAPVVYLRVREYKIQLKTQVGKRGMMPKGVRPPRQKSLLTRAQKFAKYAHIFAAMLKEYPRQLHVKINRIRKGSMKAAIAVKCLDCSGFYGREVKWCPCKTCALWVFRPNQPKPGEIEPKYDD